MKKHTAGFTLIELLIAATIVAALAVLSTVSFWGSAAETHVQAARTKAEVLATAIQQFKMDGGTVSAQTTMSDLSSTSCGSKVITASTLMGCGYLRNGGWNDTYMQFFICKGKTGDCASSTVADPLVCMKGRDTQSKLPSKYKGTYLYCVSSVDKGETLGS